MATNVTINALNTGSGFGFGAMPLASAVSAYAAHVAALQAIDPSGSYYTARDYTASTSQAGRFVDAFGGSLTYNSPNVMASPTRVVDPTSGMVYVSADGADDTAIGSANQTVAYYCAVFRSPPGQTTWSNYGSIIDEYNYTDHRLGYMPPGGTYLIAQRSGRKNGTANAGDSQSIAPVDQWMNLSIFAGNQTFSQMLGLFQLDMNFLKLHLAALLSLPTDPTADQQTAIEAEMMSYYAPLIATNPA